MSRDAPDRPYAGRLADGEHRFAVRVYYEDTDAGGVVYHANYLRYFERARSDMLALVGVDQVATLARNEGAYVVAEVTLRYLGPARLGDALVIASRVERVRAAGVVIQQKVIRDGDVLAQGRVTVALVDAGGRPRRQPREWIAAFAAVSAGTASPV